MYRASASMGLGDRWIWTLFGSAIVGGMFDGAVPYGIADNGDRAMEALTRAWERVEHHNGEFDRAVEITARHTAPPRIIERALTQAGF